jgi:carboxypeptidase PM20D1
MRKFKKLLFKLVLLFAFIAGCILVYNAFTFSSLQIRIEPIENIEIDDNAVQRFTKALSYPTISNQSKVDTQAFRNLDTFIEKTYPLLDSLLDKEIVNQFSRIYKWQGKNPKLEPILLMAHVDVVPVEEGSLKDWEVAPFSGKIKDGFIWGRGTMDDKFSVFSIIEAVNLLLKTDYIPERTIYLAFGHDEEVGGRNGAKSIAKLFEKRGIRFEFVLDEGGMVLNNAMGGLDAPLAMIGLSEKGYVTLSITANLKEGGHSSIPPKTTAVGLLSESIYKLNQNPFPAKIDGAVGQMFNFIGPEMSFFHKMLFSNLWATEGLILSNLSNENTSNALVRTTIAPTMLRGGFKDNVLPTKASAKINFRILPGETVESVQQYVREVIDDNQVIVSVSGEGNVTEPSPVSSTEAFGFQILHTTIREIFPEAVVAPSLVVGGTDGRHFTNVSDNVYRFIPLHCDKVDTKRFHGLNERVRVENYKNAIRFYQRLILNACR